MFTFSIYFRIYDYETLVYFGRPLSYLAIRPCATNMIRNVKKGQFPVEKKGKEIPRPKLKTVLKPVKQ